MKKILSALTILGLSISLSSCGSQEAEIKRVEDWEQEYPDIVATYYENNEMAQTSYGGSVPIDYLEENPNLKEFYDGYGFSIQYDRARGHTYGLEDVINTQRPKPGASCLSCKSADFMVALEKGGVEVNSMDFDQFLEEHPETDTISCYDCHMNDVPSLQITRPHLREAIDDGRISEDTPLETLSCAQCHVEYYLDPDTLEVKLPTKYGMETDDMLQYYDEIDFSDWEHPQTGAGMLKAQHPEFETFTGSVHEQMGLSCVDCHMPTVINEDGEEVKSHHWTSPLLSEEGMENTCLTCHTNMDAQELTAWVEEIQGEVTDRTDEVSDELLDFVERLSDAKESGDLSDEDLARLQEIHRHAQFKWDFVFVENSEGFHNKQKALDNLQQSEDLIKEGSEILESYGK